MLPIQKFLFPPFLLLSRKLNSILTEMLLWSFSNCRLRYLLHDGCLGWISSSCFPTLFPHTTTLPARSVLWEKSIAAGTLITVIIVKISFLKNYTYSFPWWFKLTINGKDYFIIQSMLVETILIIKLQWSIKRAFIRFAS